jgi:hypothetical protein
MSEERKTGAVRMLPGVAGVCIFMILIVTLNSYGALQGVFGSGRAKYAVLGLCTLLGVGILGLLQMRKWGWALVSAGCLMLSVGDFYFFEKAHTMFFLVRALFSLVFFLYLVRAEVRSRLR